MFKNLLSVYLFSSAILMPACRGVPGLHIPWVLSGCSRPVLPGPCALAQGRIRLTGLSFQILPPVGKAAFLCGLLLADCLATA